MKEKLKEFMDTIFADAEGRAPENRRLRELKEEMLRNLYDRYDDLVASGKTPAAAYNIAVTGVGDVSRLLDSVVGEEESSAEACGEEVHTSRRRALTPEEEAQVGAYRHRSAILTALAIAMYILCWIPLVVLGTILPEDVGGILGLCVMFVMIAGATAVLIFNDMSKPKELLFGDDDDDDDDDDDGCRGSGKDGRPGRSPVYKAISGALWALTVCVYLLVSFATEAWHLTWMIFLIATALDHVIKALFDLRR